VVGPIPNIRYNPGAATYIINKLTELYKFKFAIANSIECRAVLPDLAKRFVPTISLIHEFAAYTRPTGSFLEAILWSQEAIFSTSLTHENAVSEYPELVDHSFHILPQGLCEVPSRQDDPTSQAREEAEVLNMLRPEGSPADTLVILGVGSVNIRKGVDLFIECAARVLQSGHGENYRFIWIGDGFDPEKDGGYSVYLADQIHRSGLQKHVFFMGETTGIEAAYKASDIFLLSSRLDPLPNVALDAMKHKLPLICFDKSTGIADILIANDLGEECVAPYLDTMEMAAKVIRLTDSKSLRQRVGEQLQQVGLKEFNMESYIDQLDKIGLALIDRNEQERTDVSEITKSGLARLDYFLPPHLKSLSPDEAIRYYVRMWASGISRRKLFPGFHPGIFLEQQGINKPAGDPLANYLRAGKPDGPWQYDIITSDEIALPIPSGLRIALHLHVYYAELLPEIMRRLDLNRLRPDIFVSVPTDTIRADVQNELANYSGNVIDIKVVPNRGRDVGPFLTSFGTTFVKGYDIVGHLHTKKTADVQDNAMSKNWLAFLLENLVGGENPMADIILGRMVNDRSIGMVFPDDPNVVGWESNMPYAESLGKTFRLKTLPKYFLFPVGTMFWARVESLLPVFELGLIWQNYPRELIPYDGTILHTLERMLPLVASEQGFRSVLTNVKEVTR